MLFPIVTIFAVTLLTSASAENAKRRAIYRSTPLNFGQVYSWPTVVTRVGKQRPPHHEPDAFVFNTGAPLPGQGGPGIFVPPGGPNVFGFPGEPGRPFFPPVPGEGNGGRPGPRIPCCFGIGGEMPGGAMPGNPGIPGGMMPGNPGIPGGMMPGNPGFPGGMMPGNPNIPGGIMPPNAGIPNSFVPGNGRMPGAFMPGNGGMPGGFVPGNFMPRAIPGGAFPNAPGGAFPGNFGPKDPENEYVPEGASGFDPADNGPGSPGGIFPRWEENSGREMYDEPLAGMFPIIQMAN